ncbi:MAG: flagellar assembly protein FliW [Deltaproteobacteria bacterium]|nr:flagellar assembly protein FliW [Deltaproteobacteria bacterium]
MTPDPKQQTSESPGLSVTTRNFGTITVRPEQVLTFSPGLLGFPDLHRFVLIEHHQESPFLWLQCLDNPDLAFVVVDPAAVVSGYHVTLSPEVQRELGAEDPQELNFLVILTIPPGRPRDITANLMGPLVINLKQRQGRQLVVDQPQYSHKHRLLPPEE